MLRGVCVFGGCCGACIGVELCVCVGVCMLVCVSHVCSFAIESWQFVSFIYVYRYITSCLTFLTLQKF